MNSINSTFVKYWLKYTHHLLEFFLKNNNNVMNNDIKTHLLNCHDVLDDYLLKQNHIENVSHDKCSICKHKLRNVTDMISLKPCGHSFHFECIQYYFYGFGLKYNNVPCPLCKQHIDPSCVGFVCVYLEYFNDHVDDVDFLNKDEYHYLKQQIIENINATPSYIYNLNSSFIHKLDLNDNNVIQRAHKFFQVNNDDCV